MQNVQLVTNNIEDGNLYQGHLFKLASDPVSFQLTIHINNLFSFFIRSSNEWITYSIQDVVDLIAKDEYHLSNPFEVRVHEIISYYGVEAVKHYIKLIYDKDIE